LLQSDTLLFRNRSWRITCIIQLISMFIRCIRLIMTALCNRAGHYIFALWFLLLSVFFFLAYSQPSEIGCLPYFHTWCGLSANLGCRPETSCTLLAVNTGCKKIVINSLSAHHRTTLLVYIFATKARIDSRKKLVKQQYLPPLMSSQYGEV